MKRTWLLLAFAVAALPCHAPNAIGSVGGYFQNDGTSGTLYTNLGTIPMDFELSVGNNNGCGTLSLDWKDASGHAQSLSLPSDGGSAVSTAASSSLPADGAITWTQTCGSSFYWQLERAPAQSVSSSNMGGPMIACGSSGTLYVNLRGASVSLDLALSNGYDNGVESGSACAVTASWTDASGHAQTINLGDGASQGVSKSLPAGGVISWTSTSGTGTLSFCWQLERVVTTKLW